MRIKNDFESRELPFDPWLSLLLVRLVSSIGKLSERSKVSSDLKITDISLGSLQNQLTYTSFIDLFTERNPLALSDSEPN